MKKKIGIVLYWLMWPLLCVVLRGTKRSKVLLVTGNEVLLVKNFIDNSDKWTLPGGGAKGSETARECAARELKEEIGIVIDTRKLRDLGESERKNAGYKYTASLFSLSCESKRKIKKGLEITDVEWFPVSKLPNSRKPLIDEAILRFKQG